MQAERETAINRLRERERDSIFKGKHLPVASDIQKLHLWPRINLVMLKKGMQRGPKRALKVSFFPRDFLLALPRMLPGTDEINSCGPAS